MKFSPLIIFLIFIHTAAFSQSVTFNQYTVQEGLPSSEVYDIFQDRDGFLWFGTDNGVVKYDGHTFTTYQVKDGLSDQVVFGFHEDKRGRIWFRTYSGQLSYYENGKILPYQFNDVLKEKIKKGILLQISYDDERGLMFSTYGWIAGVIDPTGHFSPFDIKMNSMDFKKVGRDYLFGSRGLHNKLRFIVIDGKEFPIEHSSDFYNFIICTVTWGGVQLFSNGKDIFLYDGKDVKRVYTGKNKILSLSVDRNNRLWIGYSEVGAESFENQDFKNPASYNFTLNKSVTKVFQDGEGGLWFSSLEKGVIYVPNLAFQIQSNLSDSRICDVLNTSKYTLIGDYKANLIMIDHATKQIKTRKYPSIVLCMLETSSGNIWIGTINEVYILDKDLNQIGQIDRMTLFDVAEASDGSIWGLSQHLRHYDVNGNQISVSKKIDSNSKNFLVDGDNIILSNKTGGLYCLDVVLDSLREIKQFDNVKISQIQKPTDSTYLISTLGNGIFLSDKSFRRIRKFSSNTNFIADNIYTTVLVDSSLWLGTEKGIIKTTLNSLYSASPHYSLLTKNSGLPGNKVNFLMHNQTDQSIWCFTDEGYVAFTQGTQKFSNGEPAFYMKTIKVNEIDVGVNNSLSLNFDENNVQVEFGFIGFNHQDILLRYRLNPDQKWNYSTSRFLHFYSMSDGKYNVELEYSVDNANWKKAPPLFIHISPVWWKTILFQITALITVSALVFLGFRYRMKQFRARTKLMEVINDHQTQLIKSEIETSERERNRIAQELHDSVGTGLSALKLITSQLPKNSLQHTIEDQLQNSIQEIKSIVYNLSPPGIQRYGLSVALKSHIERLAPSGIQIEFNSFGKDALLTGKEIMVFRIIQELLSNSIKHSSATKIVLHVNYFDDMVNVVYEDNGIGFSYESVNHGLGLQNIESRIKSIDGSMTFESGDFGISYTFDIPLTNIQ